MSYSTRRNPGGYGHMNNVGNVGQRRPMNNYSHGGQLNAQQKPPQQQQQMRPPHQAPNIQFRNQQGQQPNQQQPPRQVPPPTTPVQPPQQPLAQSTPQQQAPVVAPPQKVSPPDEPVDTKEDLVKPDETANGDPMEIGEGGEGAGTPGKKKPPFWVRRGSVKGVSRREQMRRRNVKLSRLLQPKNAVMILNELIRTSSYIVEELPTKVDGNQFKAVVVTDTQEHIGYGRSKIQAKNNAAEAALKHFVKTNKLTEVKKDEDGNEKMDVSEDDSTQAPQPWQHLASFALFKLFSLWGEDPNSLKPQVANAYNVTGNNGTERNNENRPAKKMPPNPETINPLMLINQMLPQAKFEEIGKSGDPPNVTFSCRCTVEDQSFVGTGPNKKAAKRMAAFGACHKILGINYPTDVYVPLH